MIITVALPLFAGCIVERQPRRVVYVRQPPPQAEVVVEDPAPPPVQVEVRPLAPDPTFIWIDGGWEWRGRWVWAGGRWDHPHPGAVWMRGGWEHRGGSRVWISAHWR